MSSFSPTKEELKAKIVKLMVIYEYLNTRFLRYVQQFTQSVVKKKDLGKRQQLNKLILFKGL